MSTFTASIISFHFALIVIITPILLRMPPLRVAESDTETDYIMVLYIDAFLLQNMLLRNGVPSQRYDQRINSNPLAL